MKCPYCKWTGSFKEFGGHMSRKHRRIQLKNLRKAQKASRSARRSGKVPAQHHRGSRKESPRSFVKHHYKEIQAAHAFCRRCGSVCPAADHEACLRCGASCR